MKKLALILIPFVIFGLLACNDKTSKNEAKKEPKQEETSKKETTAEKAPEINQEFLNDVLTFRENLKDAMDDMVLNDHFEDLGSLSEKDYQEKLAFIFDKWDPEELKDNPNEINILKACNTSLTDYLQYGKQTILGDTDKANYALDSFKSDLSKLDELLKPYQ